MVFFSSPSSSTVTLPVSSRLVSLEIRIFFFSPHIFVTHKDRCRLLLFLLNLDLFFFSDRTHLLRLVAPAPLLSYARAFGGQFDSTPFVFLPIPLSCLLLSCFASSIRLPILQPPYLYYLLTYALKLVLVSSLYTLFFFFCFLLH
ncbi:hypothetical protein GYMLUDRAFT_736117 [Collybiopsis luxurians FD-317 M1]|uniref:Uncharacterized protein n=1 Tax=Collybiopsis luxurians FD-317 M1 TaxID=944289 RepID=A0A0D0CHU6_9AGAR|nr:hypothetical protein GYMLUDRAFT_736117 [Collybiopsis luxurians FD-317 M1]